MPQQISVPVSKLDFDLHNPRYPVQASQRDALEKILLTKTSKSLALAEHIAEHGQNPIDLIAVVQEGTRFVVLEGNRRASVLKVLNKPVLLDSVPPGAASPAFVKRMKAIAEKIDSAAIKTVTVVRFDSRADAKVWIGLKHTGENDGAGTVPWETSAQARFSDSGDLGLTLLDFGRFRGWFSDSDLSPTGSPFPLSTFNRLLGDPSVRETIGLELSNGVLLATVPEEELSKGVKQIVADLASGKWNVNDLKKKGDRAAYLKQFPSSSLPVRDEGYETWQVDVDSVPTPDTPPAPPPKPRPKAPVRKALIPRDFVVGASTTSPRLDRIFKELKTVDVEKSVNAVAVLFRTYIELTLDDYIARTGLKVAMSRPPQASLAEKAKGAAKALKDQGLLDKNQAANVDRLVGVNSDPKAESGSITTLHSFVHSRHSNPIPSELKLAWDNIADFMRLISSV